MSQPETSESPIATAQEYTPLHIEEQLSRPNLPEGLNDPSPWEIFNLFFTADILTTLVENTNKYAAAKLTSLPVGRRWWVPTRIDEIRVFLGIQVYMGLHPEAQLESYWHVNDEDPDHKLVRRVIGIKRFEQLERFFHISDPEEETSSSIGEFHKASTYFPILK